MAAQPTVWKTIQERFGELGAGNLTSASHVLAKTAAGAIVYVPTNQFNQGAGTMTGAQIVSAIDAVLLHTEWQHTDHSGAAIESLLDAEIGTGWKTSIGAAQVNMGDLSGNNTLAAITTDTYYDATISATSGIIVPAIALNIPITLQWSVTQANGNGNLLTFTFDAGDTVIQDNNVAPAISTVNGRTTLFQATSTKFAGQPRKWHLSVAMDNA